MRRLQEMSLTAAGGTSDRHKERERVRGGGLQRAGQDADLRTYFAWAKGRTVDRRQKLTHALSINMC